MSALNRLTKLKGNPLAVSYGAGASKRRNSHSIIALLRRLSRRQARVY